MGRTGLVIFDYSGTLSVEAALFSRPERLVRELNDSGLVRLGIVSADVFWTEIVNPTWHEGSTTRIGYAKVMEDSIRKRLNPGVSDDIIGRAVAAFVARYFEASVVHPRWQSILAGVAGDGSLCGVVATDHYAEATGYVMEHLKALGIDARSIGSAGPGDGECFFVANSADLGAHKADRRFWEQVRDLLSLEEIAGVTIIDDFGFNETTGDAYAARERVAQRKDGTTALMEDVFSTAVETIPFMIEGVGDSEGDITETIGRVSALMTGLSDKGCV